MARYQFTSESVTEGTRTSFVTTSPTRSSTRSSRRTRRRAWRASPSRRPAWSWSRARSRRRPGSTSRRSSARRSRTSAARTRHGFDAGSCAVLTAVEQQSPDISQGVTEGEGLHKEQGAGDQGLMRSASRATRPRTSCRRRSTMRTSSRASSRASASRRRSTLRPDGKTQVTLEYVDNVPVRVDAIVVSTQHDEAVKYKTPARRSSSRHREDHPEEAHRQEHEDPRQPDGSLRRRWPDGRLRPHRPQDHRRHLRRHGPPRRRRVQRQGPVEGRPPACYYARYVAKNVVAAGLARRCEVQIAYAIGVAKPVGVHVNTFGTGKIRTRARGLHPREVRHASQGPSSRSSTSPPAVPPHRRLRSLRPQRVQLEKTARAAQLTADLPRRQGQGTKVVASSTNGTNGTNGHGKKKDDKKKGKKGKKKDVSASA